MIVENLNRFRCVFQSSPLNLQSTKLESTITVSNPNESTNPFQIVGKGNEVLKPLERQISSVSRVLIENLFKFSSSFQNAHLTQEDVFAASTTASRIPLKSAVVHPFPSTPSRTSLKDDQISSPFCLQSTITPLVPNEKDLKLSSTNTHQNSASPTTNACYSPSKPSTKPLEALVQPNLMNSKPMASVQISSEKTKSLKASQPPESVTTKAKSIAEAAIVHSSGFIRPVDKTWSVSSRFGPRWGRHHNGVDLAAPEGEPVLASDDGYVSYAGWEPSGFGNLVEITHESGLRTLYGHNSKIFASVGQKVVRGECISVVGQTGRATGPHLHWEVRNIQGKPVDPAQFADL